MLYIDRGGDPRDLDDVPWEDIEAWLSVHHVLEGRAAVGGWSG